MSSLYSFALSVHSRNVVDEDVREIVDSNHAHLLQSVSSVPTVILTLATVAIYLLSWPLFVLHFQVLL